VVGMLAVAAQVPDVVDGAWDFSLSFTIFLIKAVADSLVYIPNFILRRPYIFLSGNEQFLYLDYMRTRCLTNSILITTQQVQAMLHEAHFLHGLSI